MRNQSPCRWALWGLLLLASPAAQADPPPPGGWTAEEIAHCARYVHDGHAMRPIGYGSHGRRGDLNGLDCGGSYTRTPEQVRAHREQVQRKEEERIRNGGRRHHDESDGIKK